MWKQLAHAAELLDLARRQQQEGPGNPGTISVIGEETKLFLLRVANSIFTSRELSRVDRNEKRDIVRVSGDQITAWEMYMQINMRYPVGFGRWALMNRVCPCMSPWRSNRGRVAELIVS